MTPSTDSRDQQEERVPLAPDPYPYGRRFAVAQVASYALRGSLWAGERYRRDSPSDGRRW